jgi:signal peptide peptidase SppA
MQKQGRKSLYECFFKILKLKCCHKEGTISVLPLRGVISNSATGIGVINFENLKSRIDKAFKGKNIKAVALVINSPGGSPVQTELIYKRIKQLSLEKNIPVYSFIEDISASGGYWLSLAGQEIYASHNSIIGSIGVIFSGFGFQEAIQKLGIERRVYTAGKNKSLLDPFQPEKVEDIQILKNIQKDIYDYFTNVVRTEREGKLSNEDDIFDGKFWSGKQARELGLIDNFGTLYEIIENKYGKNVVLKEIDAEKSWLKRKLGIEFENIFDYMIDKVFSKIEHKIRFTKLDNF